MANLSVTSSTSRFNIILAFSSYTRTVSQKTSCLETAHSMIIGVHATLLEGEKTGGTRCTQLETENENKCNPSCEQKKNNKILPYTIFFSKIVRLLTENQ